MKHTLLLMGLLASLSGCANASAIAQTEPATGTTAETITTGTIAESATTDTAAETAAAIEDTVAALSAAADSKSALTLDDARTIFSDTHPDSSIEVAKQEGDVYYIQGYEGSNIYKMKIGIDSGTIYLDKTIKTGRH